MTTFWCPSDILITSCWLFTAQWSTWPMLRNFVCLARTAPAHTLRRQAGGLVWGSRSTRKKWTLSQLVHRPSLQGKGEQCNSQVSHHRPRHGREPCHRLGQGKSEAQRQTRWIKEALCIRKTPICMNRDAGSYKLSHTWDQVISRSRAPSSCNQSIRSDQDVRPTDIDTLSLGNILQLCRVRSIYNETVADSIYWYHTFVLLYWELMVHKVTVKVQYLQVHITLADRRCNLLVWQQLFNTTIISLVQKKFEQAVAHTWWEKRCAAPESRHICGPPSSFKILFMQWNLLTFIWPYDFWC